MNILHHKSWHVRNKDNIARVRRDEAKAAEELKKKEDQIARAEREARLNILRAQHEESNTIAVAETLTNVENSNTGPDGHLNLFKVDYAQAISNKEHAIEKKDEKEKYEKQIGYLTYLGQYQNEDPHLKRWYNEEPKRYDTSFKIPEEDVKDAEKKKLQDPMKIFVNQKKSYKLEEVTTKDIILENIEKKLKLKKSKKDKKIKKDKKKSKDKKRSKDMFASKEEERKNKEKIIKELRQQRLKREAAEKLRQEELLKKHNKI